MDKAIGRLETALSMLRGDPNFLEYLESISQLKEELVLDNCMDEVVRDHAAMAFNSGGVYVCTRILSAVDVNVD